MAVSLSPLSKCDTALLLDRNPADVYVDYSQERTNLSDGSPDYLYEDESERTGLGEPREISVVVYLRTTSDGIILEHGDGAGDIGYRISKSGSVISCSNSGGTIVSATMTGLVSGSDRQCLISWNCRPDPVSPGVVHELALYNYFTDAWVFARGTSGPQTVDGKNNLVVNGDGAYSGGLSGGVDLYVYVRIGRRFHSTSEQSLDWLVEPTPPDLTSRVRNPMLTLDGLPIAGEGEFAGPSYLWSGGNSQSVELRNSAPLVNMVPISPAVESILYTPTRYFRAAPVTDPKFMWSTRYLRRVICSNKVNRARVRVFLQMYDLIGVGPAPVYFRAYSVTGLPLSGQPLEALKYSRTATTTVNLDHGSSGLGEWVDLGLLPLTKTPKLDETFYSGLSWTDIMLGFYFDDADASGDDTYFLVKAWTVEPFRYDGGGGGFDTDDEKGI